MKSAVDARVVDLPADHPGVHDPEYRRRRDEIALLASKYRRGAPVPKVAYTEDEHALWRLVAGELYAAYEGAAVEEYRHAAAELALPLDRLPQLAEVSKRLIASTGFRFEPVNGLLETREFWSYLAERRFPSTQYIRHASVPRYTPEPDVIHELLGHANALASPLFADLYAAFGHASSRIETDEALAFLGRVFWFTMEFGVAWERGEPRAYGAGLLSSFGELAAFPKATIRPFDLAAMGTMTYDITTYQPVLFGATSMLALAQDLGAFVESYDDDAHQRLIAAA
jgi:phenylalanine-4-hydroxylase